MTDANAVSDGNVSAGADLAAFVRTPFGAQCARVGLAALASTIGALAICALLPSNATSSTPPDTRQARKAAPAGQIGASINVAEVWAEEQALIKAVNDPDVRLAVAYAWSPAGGLPMLQATRFPSAGNVRLDDTGTETAAVPLPPRAPVARVASIRRQAVAPEAPSQETLELASLPPQTPEPGYFNFFRKFFADPDQAAQAILAANPKTAIYDIKQRVVYLPNGDKLEAHSGFGEHMDDPATVARKNLGVTPPNVYTVTVREKLFHGVRALRMTPVDKAKMYGRDGILAHSFLLGEAGASNGCVSIREYDKFLQAYDDGAFRKIIVLLSVDEPAPSIIASAQPGNV